MIPSLRVQIQLMMALGEKKAEAEKTFGNVGQQGVVKLVDQLNNNPDFEGRKLDEKTRKK
jgi:hypothetical protein